VGEAELVEQGVDPRRAASFAPREAERDVGPDVEVGEQRVVLGDVPDASSLDGDVDPGVGVEPHVAVDLEAAALRACQPREAAQRERLSAPGRAEQHDHAVGLEVHPQREARHPGVERGADHAGPPRSADATTTTAADNAVSTIT
jgi:hypothetical protein